MPANQVRTFVAVEIPFDVKDRATKLVAQLRRSGANVKWVAPEHMHWTLKFLGPVDLVEIPAVCDAVKRAAEPLASFDVEAFGAGAFPDAHNPRTVWIGVREGAEAMIELHDAVEFELAKLGFRSENRKFRPHLTIGRVRQGPQGTDELATLLQEHANFDGSVSHIEEVVVFSSELGREGPVYEPLAHVELRGH